MKSIINNYISLFRPHHWIKNLIIFFPPFFSGSFGLDFINVKNFVPFIAFCLISSSGYIVNDILDVEYDKQHSIKKNRPLASGLISKNKAYLIAVFLFILSIILSYTVGMNFSFYIIGYLILSLFYSFYLKKLPVIDIFTISAGFLIRITSGGIAYLIEISEWLFVAVFLVSLLLATGKRAAETTFMSEKKSSALLKSIDRYPPSFLMSLLWFSAGASLVSYTVYVIEHNWTIYNIPLVTFGLLRYIYIVAEGKGEGDPTKAILSDKLLMLTGVSWILIVWWSVYN